MHTEMALFENYEIRRIYDEAAEMWWFSVVGIIQVLTQQPDYQTARKYWNKLKERLGKEGSQLVTNCHQLKMTAAAGKQRATDAANAETLLRLIQSVPSPKAEPIKLWLAKVGYERMQEMADPSKPMAPELAVDGSRLEAPLRQVAADMPRLLTLLRYSPRSISAATRLVSRAHHNRRVHSTRVPVGIRPEERISQPSERSGLIPGGTVRECHYQ